MLTEYADLTALAAPPWNDLVVDPHGTVFVGQTGFAFPAEAFAPARIAAVTPDGTVRLVAEDVAMPNGMAVTPDGRTLLVAESFGGCITAFDIEGSSLSGRRVWAPVAGAPDGICLDAEGAVWFGDVPNRCCVRVAEGGRVLQRIELDQGCFACTLGGTDGRTLFMVTAEWRGTVDHDDLPPTGQVLAVPAPAAAAALS